MDRQADRQIDRGRDRDGQTDRQTDGEKEMKATRREGMVGVQGTEKETQGEREEKRHGVIVRDGTTSQLRHVP